MRRTALIPFIPLIVAWSEPQSAVDPKSPDAALVADLWWVMLIGGTAILLLVTTLLIVAILRARSDGDARGLSRTQAWAFVVSGGILLPAAVIFGLVLSGVYIGRDMATRQSGDLTIEVLGQRWWWEFRYLDEGGRTVAVTANEAHIPTGREVRFLLKSNNVIHSFWVPNLQGKTDLIPGRVNETWLMVPEPGVYRGQCAEFCGVQHALMGFLVVAEPPEDFGSWLERQSEPASPAEGELARRGEAVFVDGGCATCHTIRGTTAEGELGPDLTHVGSRQTLAAATLPNTRGHLGGWIADPQHAKPENLMPPTRLAPEDLRALLAYLEDLQ